MADNTHITVGPRTPKKRANQNVEIKEGLIAVQVPGCLRGKLHAP
jgi:hypothetical protein